MSTKATKLSKIAEKIKSRNQRRKMMNENDQIEIDDQKDEEMVIKILKRMKNRGKNIEKRMKYIKEFMFNTMHQLCYKNNGNNGNNENEEKINENNKNQSENDSHLSQLIDISRKEMCNVGHWCFRETDYFDDEEDLILNNKCIKCGSKIERKYCYDCASIKNNDSSANINPSDVEGNVYCLDCRESNAEMIKKRIKTDGIKSEIIRRELVGNPDLEMDIICNMPRKTALNSLLFDINKLEVTSRGHWILFMFDMDYLKAWNDSLGHDKTDGVIEQIGNIMHKYNNEINNGKWEKGWTTEQATESLEQSFTFRTGGDEFVMVVKCGRAAFCKLYNFYNQFKSEINALGKQYNIKSATDRKGNKIDLSIVGISCGIYIPDWEDAKNKESNWLDIADTQALETA
eukprot:975013_1